MKNCNKGALPIKFATQVIISRKFSIQVLYTMKKIATQVISTKKFYRKEVKFALIIELELTVN